MEAGVASFHQNPFFPHRWALFPSLSLGEMWHCDCYLLWNMTGNDM